MSIDLSNDVIANSSLREKLWGSAPLPGPERAATLSSHTKNRKLLVNEANAFLIRGVRIDHRLNPTPDNLGEDVSTYGTHMVPYDFNSNRPAVQFPNRTENTVLYGPTLHGNNNSILEICTVYNKPGTVTGVLPANLITSLIASVTAPQQSFVGVWDHTRVPNLNEGNFIPGSMKVINQSFIETYCYLWGPDDLNPFYDCYIAHHAASNTWRAYIYNVVSGEYEILATMPGGFQSRYEYIDYGFSMYEGYYPNTCVQTPPIRVRWVGPNSGVRHNQQKSSTGDGCENTFHKQTNVYDPETGDIEQWQVAPITEPPIQ